VISPEQDDVGDEDGDDEADDQGTAAFTDLGPWWAPRTGVDLGLRAHLDEAGNPRIIERRFEVTEDHAGHRLDHYLKRMIPRLSRTRIQTVIKSQLSRGEGDTRPFRIASTVAAGDTWVIRRPARQEPPCPRTFDVLHKDESVLIVDKPAGLPVHATAKFYFNTLARVISERFPDEAWHMCHRLDRETSGVLVLARAGTAAVALKACFAGRSGRLVDKEYTAIVKGDPPWPDAGSGSEVALDFPLWLAQPGDPSRLPHVRMLVREGGLPSTTMVSVIERVPGYALVRCRLLTGRQHQIRAHVAHAGFPIVGDKIYEAGEDAFIGFCDRGWTRELALAVELPRQALHASRVGIPHPDRPASAERLEITAPLAWDMQQFMLARRSSS
jgi:23S rRNA pseudouridine1911/1915/1917 synthase